MTLVSQMRGAPPTRVVRMRIALPVGPKPPLMSRHYASMGLDVGLRACVLPTGKFPPLTPLKERIRPQELGKNLRVPMIRWGKCVQNKAHWPAINRSITEERR